MSHSSPCGDCGFCPYCRNKSDYVPELPQSVVESIQTTPKPDGDAPTDPKCKHCGNTAMEHDSIDVDELQCPPPEPGDDWGQTRFEPEPTPPATAPTMGWEGSAFTPDDLLSCCRGPHDYGPVCLATAPTGKVTRDKACARCNADSGPDVDFHCSTCWRNAQAHIARVEAELAALRKRIGDLAEAGGGHGEVVYALLDTPKT